MRILHRLALQVPPIRRLRDARDALLAEREALAADRDALAARLLEHEAASGAPASRAVTRFFHYNAVFDPEEIMRRHAAPGLAPRAGYLTNFLGVLVDPRVLPSVLTDRAGTVEPIPIPANWHADIAEWGAALRAVDLARGDFTVAELGCGWGCWLTNSGVAARRGGLRVRLVGVEGDRGFIRLAEETAEANGLGAEVRTLHHGVAAATAGVALFPRQGTGGENYGLEPVFAATEAQRRDAVASGAYDELPMVPLADVAAAHPRLDLLHVDIQGGEADLIEAGMPVLRRAVAYLVVGTHSRQIEGRLFAALRAAGWQLEIERPAFLHPNDMSGAVIVDGVQGWRNPALFA